MIGERVTVVEGLGHRTGWDNPKGKTLAREREHREETESREVQKVGKAGVKGTKGKEEWQAQSRALT